jgi:hypothetical protein
VGSRRIVRSTVNTGARTALPRYERPDFPLPKVPRDITRLSVDKLMTMFVELTQWRSHIEDLLAQKEVEEESAEDSLERIKGKNGYDFRKPEAKARACEDQHYTDAVDVRLAIRGERKRLAALHSGISGDVSVVSRDLSRRIGVKDSGSGDGRNRLGSLSSFRRD